MVWKIIGATATLIGAGAGAIAIWEWATDDTVRDADDIVESIERLTSIVSQNGELELSEEQLQNASAALEGFSSSLAGKAADPRNSATFLNVLSGAFVLTPGQSADVTATDGDFATIAYVSDNTPGSASINVSFNGDYSRVDVGHVFNVTEECLLTYMSTTGTSGEPATFRFRCRN